MLVQGNDGYLYLLDQETPYIWKKFICNRISQWVVFYNQFEQQLDKQVYTQEDYERRKYHFHNKKKNYTTKWNNLEEKGPLFQKMEAS